MSEDTRIKLSMTDLVSPPVKPYTVPIPDESNVYNYRFVKEVRGFFPFYDPAELVWRNGRA